MSELKSGKTKEVFEANVQMIIKLGFTEEEAKKIASSKAKTKSLKR